ncbi:flagellar hook-associated protein FlgK [Paracraurococcus lichenis]|uniref:Flagellar hook-associated protein 1 n=1 Tax=Paracraurococcus lichenis TaxID=3064888 RepID=A0ABT9E0X9_9PROT|nr:flagellar basal body rod C-terminal domain-containing protein [Paracraurococcus sp. LOR1-02]MDO9709801.1 flagellar basal body rod C-terminal domain-containing protein [Paracraurococcus sp. LOR1-02]
MSLDSVLTIARSGLAAVQRELAQASQNIANAETPGYTRKAVPQQSLTVGDSPAGLRSGEAQRSVDTALLARLDASRAAAAGATLREQILQGVEQAHGAAGETIADGLSDLRSAFLALQAAPADAGKQRTAAAAAATVAARLNGVSDAIGAARQQAQDSIVAEVAKANAALHDIADLTTRLKAGGTGDAAALEDQRDQAIATLSEVMDVQAVRRDGGDLLLVARGGIVLPLEAKRDVLATAPATVAPDAYCGAGGTLPGVTLNGLDITGQLLGGRLGESLALRDRTLPRYQAEADVLAGNLAARMDGEGLTLFTDADGSSVPDPTQPYAGSSQVGFAGRIRVNPAVDGNPALLRDGTHAVLASPSGATDFTPNPSGGPAGFTTLIDRVLGFSLGAEAASGQPWTAIAGSGLGPDGGLASPFAAPATLADYAGQMVAAQVGDRASATAAKEQAAALGTTLEGRFAQQSGVDTDAEMASIVALQNAYAANARVLGTVQTLWETLMGAVR